MVLPPVVGGVALRAAFSLRSPLGGWLYDVLGLQLTFSPAGVVLAQTFVAMPFYVLTVEAALAGVDTRYEEILDRLEDDGVGCVELLRRVKGRRDA
jgi:molybdate transport system permease protein